MGVNLQEGNYKADDRGGRGQRFQESHAHRDHNLSRRFLYSRRVRGGMPGQRNGDRPSQTNLHHFGVTTDDYTGAKREALVVFEQCHERNHISRRGCRWQVGFQNAQARADHDLQWNIHRTGRFRRVYGLKQDGYGYFHTAYTYRQHKHKQLCVYDRYEPKRQHFHRLLPHLGVQRQRSWE